MGQIVNNLIFFTENQQHFVFFTENKIILFFSKITLQMLSCWSCNIHLLRMGKQEFDNNHNS